MDTFNVITEESKIERNELTIEKLKEIQGFGNICNEEAIRIIDSVKELSILLFYICKKE